MRNRKPVPSLSGWYLRSKPKGIFGKPDFGNKTRKIVVFINDCFLNRCPEHFKMPSANVKFWRDKIRANVRHGKRVDETLLDSWWMVVRIWEHEVCESLKLERRRTAGEKRQVAVV